MEGWLEKARCRGKDASLFFPGQGNSDIAAKAKAICANCPVELQCLEFALAQGPSLDGIWAGTNPKERLRLARSRRRTRVTQHRRDDA